MTLVWCTVAILATALVAPSVWVCVDHFLWFRRHRSACKRATEEFNLLMADRREQARRAHDAHQREIEALLREGQA